MGCQGCGKTKNHFRSSTHHRTHLNALICARVAASYLNLCGLPVDAAWDAQRALLNLRARFWELADCDRLG